MRTTESFRTRKRTARTSLVTTSLVRMAGAAVLAAAATLVACGGGEPTTGVSGKSVLDANAIDVSAAKLQQIMTQQVLVAVAAEQGALLGAGAFDRTVAQLPRLVPRGVANVMRLAPQSGRDAARVDAFAQANVASRHVAKITAAQLIPDSLLGKTFVPDGLGQYSVSVGATGAPANGVRFVVRTLGTTHDIGYADLTQSISGSSSTLTLDVTPVGGHVVLHNVETTTSTNLPDGSDSFVGYVTNGTDRIDYTEVEQTAGARGTDVTTVTAPFANVTLTDTSVVQGMTATDVDVTRITVGSAVIRFTTGTVAQSSPGTYVLSDTTNVTANGAPFARIVTGAGTTTFARPDGSSLSSADHTALNAVGGIIVFAGMTLVTPLAIVFWLSLLTASS